MHTPQALGRADVRRCGTLWVAALDEQRPPAIPIPGVRIRRAGPDDIGALRRAMIAAGADDPDLAAVRVQGARLGCLAADDVGDVLAYGWVARTGDTVDDLGFPLELPPSEGWIYDCATIPAARGRGLYVGILRTLFDELTAAGAERAWIGTAPGNWPSQRGIARAGFAKFVDADWSTDPPVWYGAPGIPDALLQFVAQTLGDTGTRILPGAGIPWIEVIHVAPSAPGAGFPEGLRRFRAAYGEQLHWTERTNPRAANLPRVTLRALGAERTVAGPVPYEGYVRALEEIAPGLPLLGE